MNTISFEYPKNTLTPAELSSKFKEFRDSQKAPTIASLPKTEVDAARPIEGVNLFAKDVQMIHEIASSTNPLSEAVSNQKLPPNEILGILSSSLLSLEFTKMQSAYKNAINSAKTEADKVLLNANWQEGIEGFKSAYAEIGLKGIGEKNMISYSTELLANKEAFDSIVNINNSKRAVETSEGLKLAPVALGKFETYVAKVDDPLVANSILPPNLCSLPFAQGSFTKHLGHTFSLKVTLTLPCIVRWVGPFNCKCIPVFGWCQNTYTLANLSYNVDLNIGYRLTCCGGSAWGFASAEVCASVVGKAFCASCSAGIIAVVGVGRTSSTGASCTYGLGLTAGLKCIFGGVTVVDIIYPFGYSFTGPCPPLPC